MELDQKIKSNDHDNTIFEEDEPLLLPGFRFSPTDEELLGFYLRRKVEKKCPNIELIIKHVDIYNYNPWDLPIGAVGEKEMYVFCKRGRKYKNSFRPNRVAGSGFWKATGIDKLIYDRHRCNIVIGLKKTLVFYCGSAGKGTKTNWMMHEFRLPPATAKTNLEQAEVWTVCRILKREVGHKKNISSSSKQKQNQVVDWSCYETIIRCSSSESDNVDDQVKSKTTSTNTTTSDNIDDQLVAATSNYVRPVGDDYDIDGVSSWDELRPMIHFIL